MRMSLFEVRTQLLLGQILLLVVVLVAAVVLVGTTYSSTTLSSAQAVFTSTRRAVILHGPIRQVRRPSGLSGRAHTLQLLLEDLATDLITTLVLLVLGKFPRCCRFLLMAVYGVLPVR